MRIVLDCETDNLLDEATKIHCLCYHNIDTGESKALTDYDDMRTLLNMEGITVIGHNIIRFDIPIFKKILNTTFKGRAIDTLALSQYLYPLRDTHNLADWGFELDIEKPLIDDWEHGTIETYIHRCQEDVKINTLLLNKQIHYLQTIYQEKPINRIIDYLMFKFNCAEEQERVRWRLDKEKCEENLAYLEKEAEIKRTALGAAIPPVATYRIAQRPKVFNKKDGSFSANALKWLDLLKAQGLPDYHIGDVKVITGNVAGNPGSHAQIKSWLYSLGWIPETFKFTKPAKEKHNPSIIPKRVPQLRTAEGEMCPSVERLIQKEPSLENLRDLFVISHRVNILKGFLRDQKNGWLQAKIMNFTNTLRFVHTEIVNLPTLMKPYGEKMRGCLIAPSDDHLLCGSDVSGLEESTKHHYMWAFDPEYVTRMRQPGYDPHLDVAVAAGLMTQDEANWFKWQKAKADDKKALVELFEPLVSDKLKSLSEEKSKELKARLAIIRDKSKKSNFASVYGAGAAKIALTAGIEMALAQLFHRTYWKINWSVKKIANSCVVRTVDGQMWLYNPVSQFFYSLRFEKDKFSTLNQSTGVYCFDTWVLRVRRKGLQLCGQFHDEIITPLLKTDKEIVRTKLLTAMDEANEELKLNVKLGISIDFGRAYSDIH